MPSDVTGSSIYNQRLGDFEFRPGPVFTNLLLGDEINRSPPKTQAALLEASAGAAGDHRRGHLALERPFLVVATQNPIEFEGTYPLPEAQLDRFLMRLSVGYLSADAEWRMLERRLERTVDEVELDQAATPADVLAMQRAVEEVHVAESVGRYIVELVSRPGPARGSRSGRARGAAWPCSRWPGPGPPWPAATLSPPRTSRRSPSPPWPTGCCPARAVGAPGPHRGRGRRAARAGPDPAPRGRAGRRPVPPGRLTGRPVTRRPSAKIAAYTGVAALALLAGLALGRPELVAVAARWPCSGGRPGRRPRPGAGRRGRRRPGTRPGRRRGHRRAGRCAPPPGSSGWRCCWSSPRHGGPRLGDPDLGHGRGPGRGGGADPGHPAHLPPLGRLLARRRPPAGPRPVPAVQLGAPPGPPRLLKVFPVPDTLRALVRPSETLVSTGSHGPPTRRRHRVRRSAAVLPRRPAPLGQLAATARRGELMVNQRHPERATDVVLFPDSSTSAGPPAPSTRPSARPPRWPLPTCASGTGWAWSASAGSCSGFSPAAARVARTGCSTP